MWRRQWLRVSAATCGLAAAAACQSQADTTYRGEALAELHGSITTSVDDPPPGLRAMLAWSNTARFGDVNVIDEAVQTAEFPIQFQISLYEPPVDDALNDYTRAGMRPDEARIGVAHIVALPPGFDPADEESLPDAIGIAEHQLLVYVDRDVLPGTFSAGLLHGELEAGYHLMDVVRYGEPGCDRDEFDCMFPAPDDLETEIRIRIDLLDLLEFPDWT